MASAPRLAPIHNYEFRESQLAHLFPIQHPVRDEDKTKFDCEVERLGLTGESLKQLASGSDIKHRALRVWAKRNFKHRYIPEVLLATWGIRTHFEDSFVVDYYLRACLHKRGDPGRVRISAL